MFLIHISLFLILYFFFFFNDTATTEIYTLSLHDALPIWSGRTPGRASRGHLPRCPVRCRDRKSTRLNSSHRTISYAVFCLKKKNTLQSPRIRASGIYLVTTPYSLAPFLFRSQPFQSCPEP